MTMTDDEARWDALFGALGGESTRSREPNAPLGILPQDLVELDGFGESAPVEVLRPGAGDMEATLANAPLPEVVVLAPVLCGEVDAEAWLGEGGAPEVVEAEVHEVTSDEDGEDAQFSALASPDDLAVLADLLAGADDGVTDEDLGLTAEDEEDADADASSWLDAFGEEPGEDDGELDPEVRRALGLDAGDVDLGEPELVDADELDEDIDRSGKADTQSHQACVELVATSTLALAGRLGWVGQEREVRATLEHLLWDSGNPKARGRRLAELLAEGRRAAELELAFEVRRVWRERFAHRGMSASPAGTMSWSMALRMLDGFDALPEVEEVEVLFEELLEGWVEDRAQTRLWWGHEPHPGQGPHAADAMPIYMVEYLEAMMEQGAACGDHALAVGERWEWHGRWQVRPDHDCLVFGCRGFGWRVSR